MKNKTVKDIQQELANITKAMYSDELEILSTISDHALHDMIFEMASFLFGDYKENYTRLICEKRNNCLSEEELHVEHLIFFSEVTNQVYNELVKNYKKNK
jgi:hypothetical protein